MEGKYTYDALSEARPAALEEGGRGIRFAAFDTDVHIRVFAPAGADPGDRGVSTALDGALVALRDRCRAFERTLSRTRPDSDISRAHAAAPDPVDVAPETAALVSASLGYCAASEGRFDITMGTVTSLWDFRERRVPASLALARATRHVDHRVVHVGERREGSRSVPTLAIADPEAVLDLGGIAKGYIADELAGDLARASIERFAINLGGNVMVSEPDGGGAPAPWRVGIVDPHEPARFRAVVELMRGSVVTSGAHERRFTRGGVTYHHILDPRNGLPAVTDAASASIVSARSIDGDGWSTTVFMLGIERGLAHVEGLSGVEAILVDEAGRVHATSGLEPVAGGACPTYRFRAAHRGGNALPK